MPRDSQASPKYKRLWPQLLLAFLIIGLTPVLVATLLTYKYTARSIEKAIFENLSFVTEQQSHAIAHYIEEVHQINGLIAHSERAVNILEGAAPIKKEPDPAVLKLLKTFGLTHLHVLNTDGKILYSADENAKTANEQEIAEVFKESIGFLKKYTTTFSVFLTKEQPGLFLASPVVEEQSNRLLGVIITEVDLHEIYTLLNTSNKSKFAGETTIAIEKDGRLIFLDPKKGRASKALPGLESAIEQGGKEAAIENKLGEKILAAWEFMPNQNWGIVVQINKEKLFAFIHKLRTGALIIMSGTFFIIVLVVILLTRSITRPILALNTSAHNIAQGDLVTPIPNIKNQNEIGILAESFREIQHYLGSLVHRVQNSVNRLGLVTRDIVASFKQQNLTIRQTEQTSTEITQAAKKIAETVHELTRTMEEVNHVAHGTARVAEAGLGGLNEIETTMNDLQSSTQSVSEQLSTIEKNASSIRSIITTMTQVTDQANLLSLNASIQARKAGDHGKGFNIVAQEIRRMADQTAVFTLDIEKTVKDVLESVQVGVNGMNSFSLNVQFSTENIASISSRLSQTIQKIQGLPLRLEEVFRGMQSQTKEAGQIKNAMEQLSKTARQSVEALSKTDSALGRLEEIAGALEREIENFKTKDSV